MKSLNPSSENCGRNGVIGLGLVPGQCPPTIVVKVSHGPSRYNVAVPSNSTFGDLKSIISHNTGLNPEQYKLFFGGAEKRDDEVLQIAGVMYNSEVLLVEVTQCEHKIPEEQIIPEEVSETNVISKGEDAVAEVRREVDKLAQQVPALQAVVESGNKVDEKEIVYLSEMLMRQLLKLDGVGAEGEGRVQRKMEVRRVQSIVETLDALKSRNSNSFTNAHRNISAATQQRMSDSGCQSINNPSPMPPSTPSSSPMPPPTPAPAPSHSPSAAPPSGPTPSSISPSTPSHSAPAPSHSPSAAPPSRPTPSSIPPSTPSLSAPAPTPSAVPPSGPTPSPSHAPRFMPSTDPSSTPPSHVPHYMPSVDQYSVPTHSSHYMPSVDPSFLPPSHAPHFMPSVDPSTTYPGMLFPVPNPSFHVPYYMQSPYNVQHPVPNSSSPYFTPSTLPSSTPSPVPFYDPTQISYFTPPTPQYYTPSPAPYYASPNTPPNAPFSMPSSSKVTQNWERFD